MKRRSYILLEVVVACFLVGLCAFPLVSGPMRMFAKEKEFFVHAELYRVAECAFAEVYADMCAHTIAWEAFTQDLIVPVGKIYVQVGDAFKMEYEKEYLLHTRRTKMGKDGWEHRLVDIVISFKKGGKAPIAHTFTVYVKREKHGM